ncbi:MAG: CoA transferase [Candidatus Binataceae bacterium]|jgi:crotonobetainyl-CoA:carnitine CoA-transferase CaiB-like acyl-CoA transferase
MLNSCRVLDLTNERGMLCGQILGDLGAGVIAIERPGGSAVRQFGPFYENQSDPNRSIYFWAYNRNKRAVTLNLETAEGRELLLRLAARADFLIESDNPGAMAALRLGPNDLAAVNPALVYVSITPFGQDGPKAHYADSDLIIMAAGGPLILYGDEDRPPIRMSVPQAYLHACADAAGAALIGYYERLRSGQGQSIDIAAAQSVGLAMQSVMLAAPLNAADTRRMAGGAKMGRLRIPLVWQAKDGQVSFVFLFGSALGPFTVRFMDYLYEIGGCDKATHDKDWIAFGDQLLSGKEPMEEYERIKGVIAGYIAGKTKAEIFELARAKGFLMAPVATVADVLANPQFQARNYWQILDHPELGREVKYPGPFAKFSQTPITYRRRPPLIGEHNREIYQDELGLTAAQLADYGRRGII